MMKTSMMRTSLEKLSLQKDVVVEGGLEKVEHDDEDEFGVYMLEQHKHEQKRASRMQA